MQALKQIGHHKKYSIILNFSISLRTLSCIYLVSGEPKADTHSWRDGVVTLNFLSEPGPLQKIYGSYLKIFEMGPVKIQLVEENPSRGTWSGPCEVIGLCSPWDCGPIGHGVLLVTRSPRVSHVIALVTVGS